MVTWSEIDTVLLDMDGTLLDLHFDNYFWLEHVPRRYAEKNQLPEQQAYEQLLAKFNAHRGTLNWYCLDFWSEQLQLDIVTLKQEIKHKIAFRPQVKDFLDQLRTAGKHSIIVTNAHQGSLNLKLEHTDLGERVDKIICSHDFDMPKENPEFWQAIQQEIPFQGDNTLLIDDSLAVLASARTFGIKHLLSIVKPDSQQPDRSIEEFDAVQDFSSINPNQDKPNHE